MKRLFLLLLYLLNAATITAAERLNVVMIFVDDLRPELGCYDSPQVISPHIDKLASRGMRFDRAYCQVAVCGASRASLMTGVLPTRERFTNYLSRADEDAPGAAILPQVFREAGYTTLSLGKVFHNPEDSQEKSWSEPAWKPPGNQMQGLDPETMRNLSERQRGRFYESPDVPDDAYPDGQVAAKAIESLQQLHKTGKPFFLACGFLKPHLPFYAPKKYWDLYDHDQIILANNRARPQNAPRQLSGSGEFRNYHLADFDEKSVEFHRMMRHGYLACTSYVDKLTGDVLDELDRLGIADNTIIVLWGDHGFHLGEHEFWGKHNTMHLATHVPLIVRVPGKEAGATSAIVETSDIFPTLCELAGLPVPPSVQGKSFTSLLDHPEKPFREVAYSRFGPGDAVISKHFNYTNYQNGRSEMLYDLENDPQENINIAGDPAHADTLATMRALLRHRQTEAANWTTP
jgi:arylsulfatase A-like enzyme